MSTEITIELGKRIKLLRNQFKLSQEELAEKAGISKTHLGQIERGQSNVTIQILSDICVALGVPVSEIFREIETPDTFWKFDEPWAEELYKHKIKEACYPPKLSDYYPVSTLFQFFMYLPLIHPYDLARCFVSVAGDIDNRESYVLKQINYCIKKIPDSKAKQFADLWSNRLTCDGHIRSRNSQDYDSSAASIEENQLYDAYNEWLETYRNLSKAIMTYTDMVKSL